MLMTGVALTVAKAATTMASSENISTSGFLHTTVSHQNSSGLDQTTLQNETSQNWIPLAVA